MALPNPERLVATDGVSKIGMEGIGSVGGWLVSLISSTVGFHVGTLSGGFFHLFHHPHILSHARLVAGANHMVPQIEEEYDLGQ